MGPDPTAGPGASQGDDDSSQDGGFSVTITSNGDGTYQVSQTEDQDADDAAGGGGDSDDSGPQQASSISEALQIAGEMLSEEASEDGGGSGGGDDGSSNPNAPLSSKAQAQAVWNQMAKKKSKGGM